MRAISEICGFLILVGLIYIGASVFATMLGEHEAAKRIATETGKCPVSSYNVYEIECK